MKFSKIELRDLFFAWIITSLAFAILFSGGIEKFTTFTNFFIILLFSCLTGGIAFILHEVMHKYFAQKYNLWAEFRAFYGMLFFTLMMSFGGFLFAAPGAVYIQGNISKEKNGKISLAGPATNIFLAIISLIIILIFNPTGLLQLFFAINFSINSWLGLFNILPIPSFDGSKVYQWNKKVYYPFLIISILLFIYSLFSNFGF